MKFIKMQGLGNDFIVVEAESFAEAAHFQHLSTAWCDRHFGIGADGILVTGRDSEGIFMRIFNPDGSEAEMCGNGIRCIALYARKAGLVSKEEFAVKTKAGQRIVQIVPSPSAAVRVDMGQPILKPADIPVNGARDHINIAMEVHGQHFQVTAVSMGNPHAIVPVEDVNQVPLEIWGPLLEKAPLFPAGTNVEFVQIINEAELKVRVWERGAGVTLACGTGACAALVACHLRGKIGRQARLHLPGGDLWIEWNPDSNHVYMTGKAVEVFQGCIPEEAITK